MIRTKKEREGEIEPKLVKQWACMNRFDPNVITPCFGRCLVSLGAHSSLIHTQCWRLDGTEEEKRNIVLMLNTTHIRRDQNVPRKNSPSGWWKIFKCQGLEIQRKPKTMEMCNTNLDNIEHDTRKDTMRMRWLEVTLHWLHRTMFAYITTTDVISC